MDTPSQPRSEHSSAQAPRYPSVSLNSNEGAILPNANHVRIKNSNLSIINNVNTSARPLLDTLYQRVAPHAILNEGGRADDAKCLPGTREEVIGLIETWMNAIDGRRILWLSGPAGGGKTAIMKTIAERSTTQRARTINFFFFRGDTTRNSVHPVVSTLLYQLFEIHPASTEAVADAISMRPRVLDESIAQQCKLFSALYPIVRQVSPSTRIVIVIDGLDECDVEAERSQGDLLRAFEPLVMEKGSPFRLLVASRPEARIQMAFNQLPSQVFSIFLNEEYSPETDIQLFVETEFDKIKASHPSASSLLFDWPLASDVREIVTKSSGQFIYAATVMRYIAHASTVPSLSLERVKGIVPIASNSPFTHLDSIYNFILSRTDDPDAIHDILSMHTLIYKTVSIGNLETLSLQGLLHLYNSRYSQPLMESCVSELSAIVQLNDGELKLYHASLLDFLVDKTRSGIFWVDLNGFRAKVLLEIWGKPSIPSISSYRTIQADIFDTLEEPTHGITHVLLHQPIPAWAMVCYQEGRFWTQQSLLLRIHHLYSDNAYIKTYKRILRRWIGALDSNNMLPDLTDIPYAAEALKSHQRWSWFSRMLDIIRTKA